MNQPFWLNRPAAVQNERPEVGDRATLHFDQTYEYKVTVEVTDLAPAAFSGKVVAIFDRGTQTEVRGGEVLSLVGTVVSFTQGHVMAVARKPIG